MSDFSNSGASQTDIQAAVDNSNAGSTISANLDQKVSNAGKSKGVDWDSLTFTAASCTSLSSTKVTGSGYVLSYGPEGAAPDDFVFIDVELKVDGVSISNLPMGGLKTSEGVGISSISTVIPFSSSFTIIENGSASTNGAWAHYALE